MFDIRYHIISLVAVFLSLALGIVLGTVVAEKGALSRQQEALVKRLESEYKKIKDENRKLKQKGALSNKFEEGVVALLVKGQLGQSKIVIISTTEIPQTVKAGMARALEQAGAKVMFVTILTSDFKLGSSKVRKRLGAFFPENDLEKSELKTRIIEKIAEQIATPTDPAFFRELISLGLVKLENEDSLPADGVVFFAGGSEESKNIDQVQLPMVNRLQQLGIFIVGVETSYAKISRMTQYQGAGVATVDNIDTTAGQVAFIYVLTGREGHYGAKPTAQSFLPLISFQKE